MADQSARWAAYRGLLIPDPRIGSPDASLVTQAGPQPGTPQKQQATRYVMEASGEAQAGSDIRLRAAKSGLPGREPSDAALLWRRSTDADAAYRGWDQPNVITGWSAPGWNTIAGTPNRNSHIAALSGGRVMLTYESIDLISGELVVYTRTYEPSTEAWGTEITVTSIPTMTSGSLLHPCLLPLPTGRVLLFHWVDTALGDFQIRMHYSDDNGATWTMGSRWCLDTALTYGAEGSVSGSTEDTWSAVHRIRAAYHPIDDEILLIASICNASLTPGTLNHRDCLAQYASADLGALCELKAKSFPQQSSAQLLCGRYPDVVVTADGRYLLGYVMLRFNSGPIPVTSAIAVHLASAYDPWTVPVEGEIYAQIPPIAAGAWLSYVANSGGGSNGYNINDGDFALVVADNGTVYALGRDVSAQDECVISRSVDDGESWAGMGQGSYHNDEGPWHQTGVNGIHLLGFAGTWSRGHMLVAHGWDGDPNSDNSIGVAQLAGWSTVCLPSYAAEYNPLRRVGYEHNWLPLHLPGSAGWGTTGTGGQALVNGRLQLTTGAASRLYNRTLAGSVAGGVIIRTALKLNALDAERRAVISIRLADGSLDYWVEVRTGGSAIKVRDIHAGGAVIGTVALAGAATDELELWVAMSGSRIRTAIRRYRDRADRSWVTGPSSDTLTAGGTPPASGTLVWGALSGAPLTQWWEHHYSEDVWTGLQRIDTVVPDDQPGRHVSALPTYIADGVLVAATDGPAYHADQWTLATRYTHAVSRIRPTVAGSPRRGWRSTGVASAQTLRWDLPAGRSAMRGVVVGLAVFGSNWRTGRLDVTAGGVPSTLHTLDVGVGYTGLNHLLRGDVLIPDGAAPSTPPYLHRHEAAGWSADLGSGIVRRVVGNHEGMWGGSGVVPHVQIALQGSEPSSGTMVLVPDAWVLLIPLAAGVHYERIELVIDAQSTADGDLRVGTAVLGPVLYHGTPNSWGRVLETEAGWERIERRDRTDRVHYTAPPARVVQLAWADGAMQLRGRETEPDHLSVTGGGLPVAGVEDTPTQLEGALRELDGARTPLVYLPRIPKLSGPTLLSGRDALILCRLISGIRQENVVGDEGGRELGRVSGIQMGELV